MDVEDKKLLKEHIQAMKTMEQEFQKFYQIAQYILPEIEKTMTLSRMDEEFEKFKKKHL